MNFQKLLIKTAKLSPVKQFKHASILTKGGAILAVDYNGNFYHAEANVLKQLWPSKIKGTTMINIRITQTGIGMSRPCKNCWNLMKLMGVAKVIYTGRDGKNVMERVR
jgi:hypothetical protein